ncbi:MAG: SEL1-like repeat protein [Clostridia bacterium]|nr:SEL1-like repeat protein [Clostridia bacterium]
MTSATCTISRHADSGLLYTLADGAATIVGCTQMHLTSLTIPPVISEDGRHYPVTAVGESAFAYHPCLQTVQLPEGLEVIGHGSFEGTPLSRVTLPLGMQTVASCAFYSCPHLSELALPPDAELADNAFAACPALQADHVQNLAHFSDEARRRARLPAPSAAAPAIVYVDGQPAAHKPGKDPAQQLLEDGVALEDMGSFNAAAAAYMQAHAHRRAAAGLTNKVQQEARMKPVAEAEMRLALLLKFGLVPASDPDGTPRPDAQELLTLLVNTTDIADAAYHLGDMLAGGYGVPADPERAIALLKSAATRGHERACLDLGYIYLHGTLAPVSSAAAHAYFKKCADMDGPYAHIARREMAGLVGPDTL